MSTSASKSNSSKAKLNTQKNPPPATSFTRKRKSPPDPEAPNKKAKIDKPVKADSEHDKPWRIYFKGPQNLHKARENNGWFSPTKWFNNEILCQVFAESLHGDYPCQFGFFLSDRRWFGVHLSCRDQIPIKYTWRIANLPTHGSIKPGPLLDTIKKYALSDEEFKTPSSFWSSTCSFRKELIANRADVPSGDKTGYEDVRLIRNVDVDVPLWLQRSYGANNKWYLKEGLALGTVLSLGILLEVAAKKLYLPEVQQAVALLNDLPQVGTAIEPKFKCTEEKKAEDTLFKELCKDPNNEVSRQLPVTLPSAKLGRIDLLVRKPRKIIIEMKLAKFWTEAIGQIKRYQASHLKDSSLEEYEMLIFLVHCSKKEDVCVELQEARKVFPFESWGINFLCSHCQHVSNLAPLLSNPAV